MGNNGTANYTKSLKIDVTFNTGTSLTNYYIGRTTAYSTVTIPIKVPASMCHDPVAAILFTAILHPPPYVKNWKAFG